MSTPRPIASDEDTRDAFEIIGLALADASVRAPKIEAEHLGSVSVLAFLAASMVETDPKKRASFIYDALTMAVHVPHLAPLLSCFAAREVKKHPPDDLDRESVADYFDVLLRTPHAQVFDIANAVADWCERNYPRVVSRCPDPPAHLNLRFLPELVLCDAPEPRVCTEGPHAPQDAFFLFTLHDAP